MLSATLLNMLPFGIAVLNSRAKVLFANTFALDLLRNTSELTVEDGTLRSRSLAHSRALSEALRSLATIDFPEPIGLRIARTDRRPIAIVLTKLPPRRKSLAPSLEKCRIAALFSDPDVNHRPGIPLIRDLFDFTPVEANIAILLMESQDTAEISRALRISRETLRSHLKSMFHKTHARNQAELIHAPLRSPAGFNLHEVLKKS